MTWLRTMFLLTLVGWSSGSVARAAEPEGCAGMLPDARARAQAVMATLHPHDCCDATLAECLARQPSRLVSRLASDVCRRVQAGEGDDAIRREHEKRAASMLGTGKPAAIDTSSAAWAGDAAAPIQLVAYTCARCPFCSKSVPAMYEAVTEGPLKGRARLALRTFPVRSHEHSKEGGLAFEAARAQGRFWPYVLKVYSQFDTFCVKRLPEFAEAVGLDRALFEMEMARDETTRRLVEGKKEGVRNQVEATPTYFVNGKRYQADLAPAALIDAVLEEHERVTGTLCRPE